MNCRAIPLCVTWCGMPTAMTRARRATRNKVTENVPSVAGFLTMPLVAAEGTEAVIVGLSEKTTCPLRPDQSNVTHRTR